LVLPSDGKEDVCGASDEEKSETCKAFIDQSIDPQNCSEMKLKKG
jgi:hypothetical protein